MRNAWDNPLNVHLGYRYTASPICIADGVPPPEPEDSRDYVRTSYPGCRAPHAWLARWALDARPFRARLVRPDRHVAWRGDTLTRNIHTVLDQVRGAA
jgi:hypothetical protein